MGNTPPGACDTGEYQLKGNLTKFNYYSDLKLFAGFTPAALMA